MVSTLSVLSRLAVVVFEVTMAAQLANQANRVALVGCPVLAVVATTANWPMAASVVPIDQVAPVVIPRAAVVDSATLFRSSLHFQLIQHLTNIYDSTTAEVIHRQKIIEGLGNCHQ